MNDTNKSMERRAIFFMLLCSAVYFTSYLTRKNYDAVLVEIVNTVGTTGRAAGLVSTAAFITYGIGQLISGFIGDHIKPRSLIIIGMSATAVCNLLMPLMGSITPMIVLWGINGFAQALFWPPLVRMMAVNLDTDHYNRACVWVSVAANIATISVYLLASLCTAVASWKALFLIGAVGALLMIVIWVLLAPKNDFNAPQKKKEDAASEKAPSLLSSKTVVLLLVLLAAAIVLQGILRDGVATWMPTLIADTFNMSSSVSILSGIVLPIFSMLSYNVANAIERRVKNELTTSALLFGIATASAVILIPTLNMNPILSVLLVAITTGCMHGINLMLITRIPRYFDKYNKISFVSGLLNAFTYVGSGAATFLFAVLEESFGWSGTVVSWSVVAALGMIACVVTIGIFRRFRKDNEY
ncbi:MAG: MFS transporter [Clostridia bacterium]|nr:MFS transporter [Clostridia bacterium]